MKLSGAKFLLLLALGAVWLSVSGCQTDDPENISVRPWDSPTGYESGLPMDTGQHK